jgi:hypothetical protein
MTDSEFAQAFEACELSNESFHHRDHIRLAWIYLQRYGVGDATTRIAASIRRFAGHHGKSDKYHQTVTVAWMKLLEQIPVHASFAEAVAAFPQILSKDYLREFYSDELLTSNAARVDFMEPDRRPLALPAAPVVK